VTEVAYITKSVFGIVVGVSDNSRHLLGIAISDDSGVTFILFTKNCCATDNEFFMKSKIVVEVLLL
jgi:hypothetical protein